VHRDQQKSSPSEFRDFVVGQALCCQWETAGYLSFLLIQWIMLVKRSRRERMQRLDICESDLEETFARSSGPGGQNVNKVATAVTLRHRPSGISVTVQDSRSQAQNRKLARERLLDAIEQAQKKARVAKIAEREKARRRKSPRPAALKQKILEAKRRRGEIKRQRAKIEI
jgi:protein subunit release factor B